MRYESAGHLEKNRSNRRSQRFSGRLSENLIVDGESVDGLSATPKTKEEVPVVTQEIEEEVEVSEDTLALMKKLLAGDEEAKKDTPSLTLAFSEIYGDTEYDTKEGVFLHTKRDGEVEVFTTDEIVQELTSSAREYDMEKVIQDSESDRAVITGLQKLDTPKKPSSERENTKSATDVDARFARNPYNPSPAKLAERQRGYDDFIAGINDKKPKSAPSKSSSEDVLATIEQPSNKVIEERIDVGYGTEPQDLDIFEKEKNKARNKRRKEERKREALQASLVAKYEKRGEEVPTLTEVYTPENQKPLYDGVYIPEEQESLTVNPEDLFERHFSISPEELNGIEGYESLSDLQRHLVFRNLSEYAGQGNIPVMGALYEGLLSGVGVEKSGVPARGSKGMKAYGSVLEQYVRGMAVHGPKCFELDGDILPAFAEIDLQGKREHRQQLLEGMKMLNQCAGRLSNTPASWLEDGVGIQDTNESKVAKFFKDRFLPQRKQYNAYVERQQAYDEAKSELSARMRNAGFSEQEIVTALIASDKKVFEIQTVQTPEVTETIQSIEDTNTWKKVAASLKKPSNLVYFGLGLAGRTASAGMLGILAAPVVSSFLEGTRTWNRSAAELRERDRRARAGGADTSAEALPIVQAEQKILIEGTEQDVGIIGKLRTSSESFIQANARLKEAQTRGDEKTIAELQIARSRALERLNNRAVYAYDKLRLNRINFGSGDERTMRMHTFFEALGYAQMLVADNGYVGPHARVNKGGEALPTTEERIAQHLTRREDMVRDARQSFRRTKALHGALRAGGFSLAGALVADFFLSEDGTEQVRTTVSEASVDTPPAPDARIPAPEPVLGSDAPYGGVAQGQSPYENFTDMAEQTVTVDDAPQTEDAIEETATENLALGTYDIQKGDTLIGIMKEQIPEIQELSSEKAKDNAIANILNSLSKEELTEIGVRSGKVGLIHEGEILNLTALGEMVIERESILESAEERFGGEDARVATTESEPNTSQYEDIEFSKIAGGATLEELKEMNAGMAGVSENTTVLTAENSETLRVEKSTSEKLVEMNADMQKPIATLEDEVRTLEQKLSFPEKNPEIVQANIDALHEKMMAIVLKTGSVPVDTWSAIKDIPATVFSSDTYQEVVPNNHVENASAVKVFANALREARGVALVPRSGETLEQFLARGFDARVMQDDGSVDMRILRNLSSTIRTV